MPQFFKIQFVQANNGDSVSKVKTNTVGKLLISWDELHKQITLDYETGKERAIANPSNLAKKQKAAATDYFFKRNDNTSIWVQRLKPVDLFGHSLIDNQEIAHKFFGLFNNSADKHLFEKTYDSYHYLVLKAYRTFLTDLTHLDSQLLLRIAWMAENDHPVLTYDFTSEIAQNMINHLIAIHESKAKTETISGKFTAINCNSRNFTFKSMGKEYRGRFDTNLQKNLSQLNFTMIYEVMIELKEVREAGKDDKMVNTITKLVN